MAGSINNLLLFISLIVLNSCQNLQQPNEINKVYISVKNNIIIYNTDIVDYYIVNRTNKDIRILCNPDFFRREKDSLIINTWFNPKITIYENEKTMEPNLLNVNYKSKILDSLDKIKNEYVEINNLNDTNSLQLDILKKYIRIIKKNDSIKLSTKINFEGESRFYDLSQQEGYILKKDKYYILKICINESLNLKIKSFLEKENIYLKRVCSDKVKLVLIKTNYSE